MTFGFGFRGGDFYNPELDLQASAYSWQFIPIAGKIFSDIGTTACH